MSGVELVRKSTGASAHAITLPLLTDPQGQKYGKSNINNNIKGVTSAIANGMVTLWLDARKCSPYDMYQFLRNRRDAEVEKLLMQLTFIPRNDIIDIMQKHMVSAVSSSG